MSFLFSNHFQNIPYDSCRLMYPILKGYALWIVNLLEHATPLIDNTEDASENK
jgi:hypothetical protein